MIYLPRNLDAAQALHGYLELDAVQDPLSAWKAGEVVFDPLSSMGE